MKELRKTMSKAQKYIGKERSDSLLEVVRTMTLGAEPIGPCTPGLIHPARFQSVADEKSSLAGSVLSRAPDIASVRSLPPLDPSSGSASAQLRVAVVTNRPSTLQRQKQFLAQERERDQQKSEAMANPERVISQLQHQVADLHEENRTLRKHLRAKSRPRHVAEAEESETEEDEEEEEEEEEEATPKPRAGHRKPSSKGSG